MLNVQRVISICQIMGGVIPQGASVSTSVSTPLVNIPKNYGTSSFLMGHFTISMAIFNSFLMLFVCLPGRVSGSPERSFGSQETLRSRRAACRRDRGGDASG